ncbi:MAG: PHP domain-containing protein [Acidimicrobiales bacterium]|nr:PHP domain-containing protein [Acidimicrobiales bacterium]
MAALERIVHLLDRDLAEPVRVRAFLRAADVVRGLAPAELAARVGAGTLTDLPHIGDVTGRVIAEAVAGEVPAYLARLEAQTVVAPTTPGGAELRARLRGDCHTHSTWSDGGAPVEAMARAAAALGHDYLVLTDHSARLTVAHGLSRERLLAQLEEVSAVNERVAPFRVLTGIEVDILADGSLDADDDLLARLDLVVASVHSKLRMERRAMTERLVRAVASPHVDVLGHLTNRRLGRDGRVVRPESTFDPELVLMACRQLDTAVEVNCRPERLDPPEPLLALAVEYGCRFAVSTDAHAPGQLEWQPYGCDRAAAAGVGADDVVNTAGADDLLAWARSHHP